MTRLGETAEAIVTLCCALLLTTLCSCPLPQPLPADLTSTGKRPPRILVDSIYPAGTLLTVNPNCIDAQITLGATIFDDNASEDVTARWFVDYNGQNNIGYTQATLPAPADSMQMTRDVPAYYFRPSSYVGLGDVHVVELLVCSNFASIDQQVNGALPNRAPAPGYETQLFRWTFQFSSGVPCP